MTSVMSSIIPFFNHKACKDKINALIQVGLDDNKKLQCLNTQLITLMGEHHELKVAYEYQCAKLEKTITELQDKLKTYKTRRRMRSKPRSATLTSNITTAQ